MAASSGQAAKEALAARAPSQVLPGDRASEIVFAPLAFGEAPRIGLLGDTGTGKTEAARRLVAAYLARSPGVALVIDDKEIRARFAGQERRDVAELAARPPVPEPRAVIFRGAVREGVEVDAESVTELAWSMAGRRRPSLVVYDELERAADRGKWLPHVARVPQAFKQGRAVGISMLWGTQSPQDVPRAAFEQSSHIYVFRMDGLGLNVLEDRNYILDDRLAETIRALPGDELPPAQRGFFVLLRRGRPWDGFVYRYGSPNFG